MNHEKFMELVVDPRIKKARDIIVSKGKQYSPGDPTKADRLIQFKVGGRMDGIPPEEALWGMFRKHITSLRMMLLEIENVDPNFAVKVMDENLTDIHNYMYLLEGLLAERFTHPCLL